MQVKCCGDTSVRHTEVGGFNSPFLLDLICSKLAALRAGDFLLELRGVLLLSAGEVLR